MIVYNKVNIIVQFQIFFQIGLRTESRIFVNSVFILMNITYKFFRYN